MVVAKIYSCSPIGYEAQLIEVEGDATKGLPSIQIVGMAAKSIDEAKERTRSAIANSQLEYPARKLTINLAPAEIPKEGTHFDVPLAIAILVSSGQLRHEDVSGSLFAGELALDGTIRPVSGAISFAETAKKAKLKTLYVPEANVAQAALIEGIDVIGITSLKQLFLHLKKELPISPYVRVETAVMRAPSRPLLDDIYGQAQVKRALTIAAAGRHNLLLKGPPGSGKTMAAKTLPSLLPDLSAAECLAVTKIHSLAGESIEEIIQKRPFRSPHHTASQVALIGGGTKARPGEISLAHLGVLFLDEIPEFSRATLESLRQPLEDKQISISRAQQKTSYPADFMLIATMNPCPCGYYGDTTKECSCSSSQILAYQKRLSGPLLDRIDMVVTAPKVSSELLHTAKKLTNTQHETARNAVDTAVSVQRNRYKSCDKYNVNLTSSEISHFCELEPNAQAILSAAVEKLGLSTRAYFKVIRVARTIADIEGSVHIAAAHISEALQYRDETY